MSGECNMADETTVNSSEKKSAVGFSTIQIREYPIVVGDNPSILTGTPITIDWEHVEEFACTVDDYEQQKPKTRNMLELRLPARNRADMLKRQGFSLRDRQMGAKLANLTRRQRRRTAEMVKLAGVEEVFERVKRATLNATVHRGRKQKEREYLSPFRAKRESFESTEFTIEMGTAEMELDK